MRKLGGKRQYLSLGKNSLVYLYNLSFEKPKFLWKRFPLKIDELSEIVTNFNWIKSLLNFVSNLLNQGFDEVLSTISA